MNPIKNSKKSGLLPDAILMRSSGTDNAIQNPHYLVVAAITTLCFLVLLTWFANASAPSNDQNSMYMTWLKSK
jgi:hypothetical protein